MSMVIMSLLIVASIGVIFSPSIVGASMRLLFPAARKSSICLAVGIVFTMAMPVFTGDANSLFSMTLRSREMGMAPALAEALLVWLVVGQIAAIGAFAALGVSTVEHFQKKATIRSPKPTLVTK